MNRLFSLLTLILSFAAFAFTGCQTHSPSQVDRGYTAPAQPKTTQWQATTTQPKTTQWQSAPVQATRPAPVQQSASRNDSDVIFKSQQIKVSKSVLQAASVGGDVKYRIEIEALDDVNTVRVTETIPAGIQFKSARPSASLSGNNAMWVIPSMRKGQTQNIDITVTPTAEGDHQICSTVSVDNSFCLNLFSGQPQLNVVKQGPASVELGEIATWTVTVTNNGSAEATGVVVTDNLPKAFKPKTNLRQEIGTLSPGETRVVEYSAEAIAQGEFRNHAVATYDGGPANAGDSSAPITVVQSGIRIRKTGPAEAYVFQPAVFNITIENTGDTDLKNVRITDILPKGSSVADNGRGRVSGDAIGWMIPNLPAGASQLITTEIAATRKGKSTNTVKVLTENGLEASDAVTTNWLAVPGVTVSITDSKDPVRVKEDTVYSIQVRNQGQFEPVTGIVTVTFNDKIKPTAVAGDAEGIIDGQTVTFPSTTLEPGKDINLSITAEGAKFGHGRAVMNFSADFLNEPIISQETTNVY
jgi:uncharacterized repeat protein (TIGR01451 family)